MEEGDGFLIDRCSILGGDGEQGVKGRYRIGVMLDLHECRSAVVQRKDMGRVDLQRMVECFNGLFRAIEPGECDPLVIKGIDIVGIDIQGITECIDCVLKPLKPEERDSLVIE